MQQFDNQFFIENKFFWNRYISLKANKFLLANNSLIEKKRIPLFYQQSERIGGN